MGYIPKGAHWYLADIILEHLIEDDSPNVVHVNVHLIKDESPEGAYQKALALGRASELDYPNTESKQVRVVFRGLKQLNVIQDELEDGAELTYNESFGVTEAELQKWLTSKEHLGVFAPIHDKSDGPNYLPKLSKQILEAHGFDQGEGEATA